MSAPAVGRTSFQNGMRVGRVHLEHLQEVLRIAIEIGGRTAGIGRACFGLRVETTGPASAFVAAGAACDRAGRVFAVAAQDFAIDWAGRDRMFLVALHRLRSGADEFAGHPTMYFDDAAIEARAPAPPYADDAVVFAQLDRVDGSVRVIQRGEWFLPAADHTHSGTFVERDGTWRYDGHPLAHPPARFDSGFLEVRRGETVTFAHGLGDADLLVQLQARTDGVVTSAGHGSSFWYELAAPGEIRLVCAPADSADLELRAMIWPQDPAAAGPLLPLADAGPDLAVDLGASFSLDASASRASPGRKLASFIWTKIN
jgi:hypothetical protein